MNLAISELSWETTGWEDGDASRVLLCNSDSLCCFGVDLSVDVCQSARSSRVPSNESLPSPRMVGWMNGWRLQGDDGRKRITIRLLLCLFVCRHPASQAGQQMSIGDNDWRHPLLLVFFSKQLRLLSLSLLQIDSSGQPASRGCYLH